MCIGKYIALNALLNGTRGMIKMSDKKPLYLCMYAHLCGCYTIMSNNRETISAHMKEVHGWTQQDCDDTMMGDE